ncbi:MAG: hypothetical protein P8I95_07970 [Alphaproteobacteria bacterium]|nr:hypothetical protein [Alphaproteobacteria bacterium]
MGKFLPTKAQWLGFLAGLLVLNIIGAVVSTQYNLGHLLALGVDISFGTRLSTTFHDIYKMQPLFGVIFGVGFSIAMVVATVIAKWVKILPNLVFAIAGFASMLVTLVSLTAAFQITAIGAAREWDGFISLCLVGALAGYAYCAVCARLTAKA